MAWTSESGVLRVASASELSDVLELKQSLQSLSRLPCNFLLVFNDGCQDVSDVEAGLERGRETLVMFGVKSSRRLSFP